MAQLVDQAILDDKQYLAALKRIDTNVAKMTKDAQKNFDGISSSAKSSGVQIGATAGVVGALVSEFINLGKAGVDALIRIGEQAVQTAIEVDTLKARLGGIFDGSEEAAEQAFTFIQAKSKELGIDLSELAGAFLPKTESLDQFERVAKIATALARSDPEQGAIGARIALIEALSGTFTSLQRRFEIPKEDINRIKEAFDTKGMEGFLATLETVLAESGKSFEDLSNTAQTSFNKVGIAIQQLGGRAGAPVVEELKKQFDALGATLSENEDDFILIADALGRVLANVVDFIGTGLNDFLASLDTEQVIEIAETFFDLVDNARTLASVLSQTDIAPSFIDNVQWVAEKLNEALETAIKLSAIVKAETARQQAEQAALSASLGAGARRGAFGQISAGQATPEQEAEAAAAGQEAYNKVIENTLSLLDDSTKRKDENREATDNLRQSLEEAKDAGTGEADAILASAQAQRQAAQDAEALAEAQTKVNEKMAEAEQDFQQKLQDIDIQTERKRLDIITEFAQKREDAARNNLQKLEDIQRGYAQDVDDAATDLARKEEDIARKHGQDRIDLERENRQKRVDIERSYRQTIQDIQRQFLIDADEAEQKRDAVGFLRALKERNQKVQEAQINRQREIQEQQVTNTRKTEELRIQQQREIEEARIAHERKLEDLRLNLDRQIEAQNIAYERQLEEIAIGEQRKNEELALARQRDIEDAKLAYERKLEDLRVALEAELALIEEFAARKAAIEAQAVAPARSTTYNAKYSGSEFKVPAGTSRGPGGGTKARPARSIYGYAAGGNFPGGQPMVVGEAGPELLIPRGPGTIVPNSAFVGNAFTPQTAVQNISNVRGGNTVNVPDVGGLINSPAAVRMVENIVMRILGSV